MSIFNNRRLSRITGLNTASLPDLIFTVLFFFMIVTNMKKDVLKVEYRVPQGKELERLTNKSTTSYIYIGHPITDGRADENAPMRIQLNDRYATVGEIADYISAERADMSAEDAQNMKVNIKADRNTPMGTINDVKQALRKSYALDIVYSADWEAKH